MLMSVVITLMSVVIALLSVVITLMSVVITLMTRRDKPIFLFRQYDQQLMVASFSSN